MAKVFFTGEQGMIARETAKLLFDTRHHVVNGYTENKRALHSYCGPYQVKLGIPFEVDVTNFSEISGAIEGTGPDVVVHTAAYVNSEHCELNAQECIQSNVYGTWNVIAACRKIGAKLIFIGTTATYDPDLYNGHWITEKMPQKPKTLYGTTKYDSELLAINYMDTNDLVILRPCFAFGSSFDIVRDTSSNIVKIMRDIKEGKNKTGPYTLDPEIVKDYMYIPDMAQAIVEVIENFIPGDYNVSLMHPQTWESVMQTIELVTADQIEIISAPEKDYLKAHLVDSSKFRQTYGWEPKYSLHEGIKKTWELLGQSTNS